MTDQPHEALPAAVSVTSALEVMTDHYAVVAFSFGGSRDVEEFACCKNIS